MLVGSESDLSVFAESGNSSPGFLKVMGRMKFDELVQIYHHTQLALCIIYARRLVLSGKTVLSVWSSH
jgi:hypothetical protein